MTSEIFQVNLNSCRLQTRLQIVLANSAFILDFEIIRGKPQMTSPSKIRPQIVLTILGFIHDFEIIRSKPQLTSPKNSTTNWLSKFSLQSWLRNIFEVNLNWRRLQIRLQIVLANSAFIHDFEKIPSKPQFTSPTKFTYKLSLANSAFHSWLRNKPK